MIISVFFFVKSKIIQVQLGVGVMNDIYYDKFTTCGSIKICEQHSKVQLTDGLCCTCSYSSHSHHILSSH